MIDLQKEGDVFVLRMNNGENRMNDEFLRLWNEALDEVERSAGNAALVTTGEGKFYSNGIDLEWLMARGSKVGDFVRGLHALLARVLVFSVPAVAAINGHAFAGGALLVIAHDFRVMRTDRGYLCLPEVDIGVPVSPSMGKLVRAKFPAHVAHESMVTGRRYTADEGKGLGIVRDAVPEAEVLPRALALAAELASKDRSTLGAIKKGAYSDVYEQLVSETASLG